MVQNYIRAMAAIANLIEVLNQDQELVVSLRSLQTLLAKRLSDHYSADSNGLTIEEQVLARVKENRVNVIRMFRERTKVGLGEARDKVDDWIKRNI